jgi:hypothetical protein
VTDEVFLTRRQLQDRGADAEWFDARMKGRGRLSFSKIIECAPDEFWAPEHVPDFTGCVTYYGGDVLYFKGGKQHREDGPAETSSSGRKVWMIQDRRHRLDGPAVERGPGGGDSFYILDVHLKDAAMHARGVRLFHHMTEQGAGVPKIREALYALKTGRLREVAARWVATPYLDDEDIQVPLARDE